MAPLDDGTYDAFIVDAEVCDDRDAMRLEMTITSGARKGEVVVVHARGMQRADYELIGLPVTLTVRDGAPHVRVEG